MNKRTFMRIRRFVSLIGILSILSSLVVAIPTASATYSGADAQFGQEQTDQLIELGVRNPDLNPNFGEPIARAAACFMLANLYEAEAPEDFENPFTDVSVDNEAQAWFYDASQACAYYGWFNGGIVNGKRMFGGEATITREQFATVLWAMSGKPEVDDIDAALEGLSDATEANFSFESARPAFAWARDSGLIGEGEKANPQGKTTNIETNVIVANFYTFAIDNEIDVTANPVVAEEEGEEGTVEEGEEGEEVVEPPAPVAGALNVALATDTPVAADVNPGASGVPFASFTFSVDADKATVTSVTFKRVGTGASTDLSSVTLYQGATRLKAGKTIASDTNTVEFSGLSVLVEKDKPATLTVKGDTLNTLTASPTDSFQIEKAESVVTDAKSVTGVPVTGNLMRISGSAVGTITSITTVTTISKPTLGAKNVELGNFKLNIGSNDVSFKAITLTHGGTVAASNLANFVLTDNIDTTKALAKAAKIDGDKLIFVLDTAYTVPKNNNRSFRVWGDVLGGKTTDNIQFYLDEVSDLNAVDSTLGWGARLVLNSLAKASVTAVTFQGGKITLADNGPVAGNVSINTTNVHLFDFSLTSDRNVTVKDYYIWLEQTAFDATSAKQLGTTTDYVAATGTIPAASVTGSAVTLTLDDAGSIARLAQYDVLKVTSGGTDYYLAVTAVPTTAAVATTLVYPASVATVVTFANTDDVTKVFDVHLRTRVKNLKLIDTDTGGTIASVTNTTYMNVFSDDFDLTVGKTKNLAVVADLDSTLVAVNAFKAGVDFAESSYIKDTDANEYIATSDVVGGNTFGKTQTAVAASLTVNRTATPVSETHVKGQKGVNLLGLSMKAGDGGDVKVSKVTVRLMADDDNTFDNTGYGDTAANTIVDTVSLYKVNADNTETKVAGPVGLSLVGTIGALGGYYKAEFNSLNYSFAKSASERWLIKVDLKNTLSATRYLSADLILNGSTADDIEAQDKDGNTVYPAQTAGASATGVNNLVTGNPTVDKTITTAGSLTGSEEGSPSAAVLVAGATGVTMAKYKYSALNEAFTIQKLEIIGTTTAATQFNQTASAFTGGSNITRVSVSYPKKDGTTETVSANFSGGVATFTGLNFYVPKDSSATITVLADLNTIDAGAVSGTSFRLGVSELATVATNTFTALGEGSASTLDATSTGVLPNGSAVNAMVIRKTVPTVATVSGLTTKLSNGLNTIAGVTVAADAKEAVALKRLAFEFSASDMDVSALDLMEKIGGASETTITSLVSIRNRIGQNLKNGGSNLATAGATTTDTIYVTWDKAAADQKYISKGTTNTYLIRGTVANAAANESLSTYIADDTTRLGSTANSSNTAVGGIDELRTTIAANPETTAASINNTRTIWRWLFANATSCPYAAFTVGCAFLDVGGDGAYTAANDPLYAIGASGPVSGATSTLTSGAIIPGPMRYTYNTTYSGFQNAAGVVSGILSGTALGATSAVYFDLATSAGYTGHDDISIPATFANGDLLSGTLPTANAVVTSDIRYSTGVGSTTVYIDYTIGNIYSVAGDVSLIGTGVASWGTAYMGMTTAPTQNSEVYTSNANFIWSDNSAAGHATTTNDWTNGVDVPSLPTTTLSLSF